MSIREATNLQLSIKSQPAIRCLPIALRRLESESIEIMREVVAEFEKPVMLYSIGKDSSVMLHLAIKAFTPRHCHSRCFTSIRHGSFGR